MKILFYFGGFAPIGGIETFCKNLLCYLQTQKYDCRLVCWGLKSSMIEKMKKSNIQIIRSPWQWGCKWNVPDWLLLPLGIQQSKNADVIFFGKLFSDKILKKIKSQISDRTKFVYMTPYKPVVPDTVIEKKHLSDTLNLFDLILVQVPTFQDDLRRIGYKGRIELVPYMSHQLSPIQALPAIESGLKIGYLGRLVEDKNVPLLLESFRSFQNKYLQVSVTETPQKLPSLHIFGDGHLRGQLEQMAEKLGIKSSVVFHGSIPNTQVSEAIASCHLFAFTSRVEGQPLAALEILSCGRPIVAGNVGAFPEMLLESRFGKLVESRTPENFARAMLEVANLLQEQVILPETVRAAYLEQHAADQVGKKYEKLINSLS
jgi:glycosyltransferase involved in cell wall biosynthesis